MKIDLCTGENVPDPPLNAASGPRVFKFEKLTFSKDDSMIQMHISLELLFSLAVSYTHLTLPTKA